MAVSRKIDKKMPAKIKILIVSPLDDFIKNFKNNRGNNILFSLLILILSSLITFFLSNHISKSIRKLAQEAYKIKNLNFSDAFFVKSDIKEIKDLNEALLSLRTSIQSFSFYIPKTLVKRLLQRKQSIHVGGRSREITLFFSDIENFTTISENYSAEKISVHLSDYFNALGEIISNHEGTIDKFIGDAVMAFWGAPISDNFHVKNACTTALLCQQKINELNRIWKKEDKPEFKTRIGIHTGTAIVGNIGSTERMNYTVIGDNVNLCSRLEALNKEYGTKIIVSDSVYSLVKNDFYFRQLDVVIVKGRTSPIKIYELFGFQSKDALLVPDDDVLSYMKNFEKAYNLYLSRQFEEAILAFGELMVVNQAKDQSLGLYKKRCEEFIKNPPPKEWVGEYIYSHH
jgi:adenylate cyclase